MAELKMILPFWDKTYNLSNKRSIEILGMKYRSLSESLIDMAHSLIDLGYAPDRRVKE